MEKVRIKYHASILTEIDALRKEGFTGEIVIYDNRKELTRNSK